MSGLSKGPILFCRIAVITILLLSCYIKLSAQYTNFEYWTELCNCTAKFDSTKYSRQQLQNTFYNMYLNNISNIDTDATDFSKTPEILLEALEDEYRQRSEFIKSLDIVNDDFWQIEKKKVIRYLNSAYELIQITIQARLDTRKLLNYSLVDSTCIYFRNALIEGGDQLLKAWIRLNEMQKRQNSIPERLQYHSESKYNSPDRLKYVYKEVLTYGWWNYTNCLLPYVNKDKYAENFDKLLKDIKCEYDEP